MFFRDVDDYVKDALKITGGIILILTVLRLTEPYLSHLSSTEDASQSFMDQSMRWYATSVQDKQSGFALQHITYAVAYLNAARQISTDTVIERRSGVDVQAFHAAVDAQQRVTMRDLGKQCPKIRMRGDFVHSSGWLG